MYVLGIETSCDETSAAVLNDSKIISNIIFSQIKAHRDYGGVVPEIAAREHLNKLPAVVEEALNEAGMELDDVGAVAVTYGPGLAGSLITGLSYAKGLAYYAGKSFVGINHIEAHLLSPFLEFENFDFPYIGLVVSGGHTNIYLAGAESEYELIGSTRDDAAGEAFDKAAKMLGLPYPGGPAVSKAAETGDSSRIIFPQARMKDNSFDFSFSGLKTSVLYYMEKNRKKIEEGEIKINDIAAAFQKSVSRALLNKVKKIYLKSRVKRIAVTGGVAANSYIKKELSGFVKERGAELYVPSPKLCTDNGAMIAYAGWRRVKRGEISPMELEAEPSLRL